MKILELELKKYVLIVEIPRLADYEFINKECKYLRVGKEEIKLNASTLDKFELLCKGSELTEGKIKEFDLIETKKYGSKPYFCTLDYRNKGKNKNGFNPGYCSPNGKQFTNSFISAVESKGFYWLEKECDNQFCENGKVDLGYNTFLNCQVCEEAEEKTFLNPLIFVKK